MPLSGKHTALQRAHNPVKGLVLPAFTICYAKSSATTKLPKANAQQLQK
jgi:hypothetical protein